MIRPHLGSTKTGEFDFEDQRFVSALWREWLARSTQIFPMYFVVVGTGFGAGFVYFVFCL